MKNKSTFLQDYPLDLSDGIISLTDAPIKAWADVTKFIRSYPDRETPAERAEWWAMMVLFPQELVQRLLSSSKYLHA